jgi:hypothetical protein
LHPIFLPISASIFLNLMPKISLRILYLYLLYPPPGLPS